MCHKCGGRGYIRKFTHHALGGHTLNPDPRANPPVDRINPNDTYEVMCSCLKAKKIYENVQGKVLKFREG